MAEPVPQFAEATPILQQIDEQEAPTPTVPTVAPAEGTISIRANVKDLTAHTETPPEVLATKLGLDSTWGQLKVLVGENATKVAGVDADEIVAWRLEGNPVDYPNQKTLRSILCVEHPPAELRVEAVTGHDPATQTTLDSPYFEVEQREPSAARRQSERYLAKVQFPDGSVQAIGSHSYDRLEEEDGHEGAFVDQLATSSVVYIVEGYNDAGEPVKLKLSSQQCILVDRKDDEYQPYLLLSNSARRALNDIHPLGLLTVKVNPEREQAQAQAQAQAQVQGQGQAQGRPVPVQPAANPINMIRRGIRSQAAAHIVVYIGMLIMRYAPLALFAMFMGYSSVAVFSLLVVITLAYPAAVDQLELIARNDVPDTARPRMMRLVGVLRMLSHGFSFFGLAHLATYVVDFGIGTNRPGLGQIDPPQTTMGRFVNYLMIVVQDMVLAVSTLIPSFYEVFNYEIVRRQHQVKEAAAEPAQTDIAEDAPAEQPAPAGPEAPAEQPAPAEADHN